MTTFLPSAFVFLTTFIGASIGSFLNVVIWRVPEKMSLVSPPSHCPKCGSRVRWFDNVPVLSWFILRGKCRDCKKPISGRYPLVEALVGWVAFIVAQALLLGNWTGWQSQPYYWEDYANSAVALTSAFDSESTSLEQQELESASSFADAEFLGLLRSTVVLVFCWVITVGSVLMLGFVEWDRGGSPNSLCFAALTILIIALLATLFVNVPEVFWKRLLTFAGCACLGALGTFCCSPILGSCGKFEILVLGAAWGVGSGLFLAFPGVLIVSFLAWALRRRLQRQTFGLCVFFALTVLLTLECFGII